MPFTNEELLELQRYDAEVEANYKPTAEDRAWSNALDREAKEVKHKNKYTPKVAEYQKQQRTLYPEKFAARKAAWYQANKERLDAEKRDYHKLHRRHFQDLQNEKRRQNKEVYNQRQREYRRRRNAKAIINTDPQPAPADSSNSNDNNTLPTLLQP